MPNVQVTGAERLYRAASGGQHGYACSLITLGLLDVQNRQVLPG